MTLLAAAAVVVVAATTALATPAMVKEVEEEATTVVRFPFFVRLSQAAAIHNHKERLSLKVSHFSVV